MMGSLSGYKNVTSMGIVWRNPNQVRRNPRRQCIEHAGESVVYTLQEFVRDGELGHWATISGFEVVVGGRAA